ncbi:YggS family pyridoxal phosphate enzyme [Actinomycetota bacterium]|nr:YggS family pyridoxal phosphate enzyme [Actinomycetota bacterium]
MTVRARLDDVRARVATAEDAAGRPPGSVRLLLATKTQPAPAIRAAVAADRAASAGTGAGTGTGVTARRPVLLGENRVQELTAKAPDLADLGVELHLIGPLQSNKVNQALRWVTCVQSVDSLALAERLARRCLDTDRELDVLVQVNVSGERTKHGVPPDAAVDLARRVAALDRLHVRGLMTVGANSPDPDRVRAGYRLLRELRDQVLVSGAPGTAGAVELSMGMSGDLELAIAEGATLVRVGTAVFGARPPLA